MAIVYSLSLIERKVLKYAQVLYYKNNNIPALHKVKTAFYQELKDSNLLKYLNVSEQQQELTCMALFKELKSRNQQNNHLFKMQAELMYIDGIITTLSRKIKNITPNDLSYVRASNNHGLFQVLKAFSVVYRL